MGDLSNGHKHMNGSRDMFSGRAHPQTSFAETTIEPASFFGQLRSLYLTTVLKTQLEQMRESGSYDGFTLEWQPKYDVRRLKGANTRPDGNPPNLFQECDISTWIEAVCYFLKSPDGRASPHRAEFEACLEETINRIETAQQQDGYLGIYFTVVDPDGRFMNLRDMHEMYECGHMIEAALAHYQLTGSRKLINVMIKNVNLFMSTFGPHPDQLHGYPGHPELELAMLRLFAVTRDPRHLDFARYLLEERGQKREDQSEMTYFDWEAKERRMNLVYGHHMASWDDQTYCQAHLPLHLQQHILGHSVRALYLTTAAADIGGEFLQDAKRLLVDAIDKKMYVTGGFGSEPKSEGFSVFPHFLPQSASEGGGYNETCASIACMMTCERILSHGLDGKFRDILELCLLNNVLGGGSLDGKAFAYQNRLATSGEDSTIRMPWFETACCPPNLARTLGMIGGYTWNSTIHAESKQIDLAVYLYVSAARTIPLPNGESATVRMNSSMPWKGETEWELHAPPGWIWQLSVPHPTYAHNAKLSIGTVSSSNGFFTFELPANATVGQTMDLPVQILASHPKSEQDTLTVTRGPIVYVTEEIDNKSVERDYPHFQGIGLSSRTQFDEKEIEMLGFKMIQLATKDNALGLKNMHMDQAYRVVTDKLPARSWKSVDKLVFTPWFARGNRGGNGHIRTMLQRFD